MAITPGEKKLLMDFLDRLGDEMGNAGCNDLTLEATPENIALATPEDEEDVPSVRDGKICMLDFVVLSNLKRRLEQEL